MPTHISPEAPVEAPQRDPRWALHSLISGHYLSRAIYVAAKLGIADLLKDGPRKVADLADVTHSHAASLERLLRLLASANVFAETELGCFRLAPMGECLRSDVAGSQRSQALLFAGPLQQRAWSRLLDIVQTGAGPTSQAAFPFLSKYPEEAAIFNEAMVSKTVPVAGAFVAAYDCSHFSTVVELGGGYGPLLRAILKANPDLRGILFEMPYVAEEARKHVAREDLAGRCEVIGGDFFESIPRGGDAYILKSVIHDWDDEKSSAILRNVAEAMAPQGRLLLVELVAPRQAGDSPWDEMIAGSDVNMLVNTGGRERSEADFRRLFQTGGFQLTRIVATATPWSIVEGALTHGHS
jgi:O-methyltransferase domain